jgi:hypothetical protein
MVRTDQLEEGGDTHLAQRQMALVNIHDLRRQVYFHPTLQPSCPVCPPQVIHQIIRLAILERVGKVCE